MWTTPEGVCTSSVLPENDWTFPITPVIGGAACVVPLTLCCALPERGAPITSVHARTDKPAHCIMPRRTDLDSSGVEPIRYVCDIFIFFSLMIIFSFALTPLRVCMQGPPLFLPAE